jgi:hypothetical protein
MPAQTGTEKAQAGAAKANAQGHAVAADLQAKVLLMLRSAYVASIQPYCNSSCSSSSTQHHAARDKMLAFSLLS